MVNPVSEVNMENATAFIRHELRTPINAIVGYGEMVQEDLEENDSGLLPEINILLLETQKLLEIINVLVKQSDVNEKENKDLKKLFVSIPHSTNPLIEKIISYTEGFLARLDDSDTKEDIKKILLAAERLRNLVNNVESIFSDFLESLKTAEIPPELNFRIPNLESLDKSGKLEKNQLDQEFDSAIGNILVIDDNASNLDLLSRHLTRKGHVVTTSLSAKEALTLLESTNYDLILLDLIMPETNGDQFLEYLKTNSRFQHIPVIMISALDEFQSIIRCIEMGAEDYLPKQFDPILLKARIDSSLEKKRLRDKEKLYTQQVEALSAAMAKELDKGRQMQKNFLPADLLTEEGWEFAAYFSPARELAGDFYDLFELPGYSIGLVVADVCDKGVGAALFMGLFRSLIRIFSGQVAVDGLTAPSSSIPELPSNSSVNFEPLTAIKLINDYVAINHGDASMFATIFFGVLELDKGRLTYISGGHEPVFIIDTDHKIKTVLRSTGPAVGMLPGLDFKIGEIILEHNEFLVAYTDGVTEAKSEEGNFFSKEKLIEVLESDYSSSKELIDNIEHLLKQHIGEADQFDDITLLALKKI